MIENPYEREVVERSYRKRRGYWMLVPVPLPPPEYEPPPRPRRHRSALEITVAESLGIGEQL